MRLWIVETQNQPGRGWYATDLVYAGTRQDALKAAARVLPGYCEGYAVRVSKFRTGFLPADTLCRLVRSEGQRGNNCLEQIGEMVLAAV